jgi:PKD repeat protein
LNRLGGLSARTALLGIVALVVVGGFVLALLTSSAFGLFGTFSASTPGLYPTNGAVNQSPSYFGVAMSNVGSGGTEIVGQTTVTTVASTTTQGSYPVGGLVPAQNGVNVSQGSPTGAGGEIEFSSDLTLRTSSPEQTASGIVALAYSVGGYVAYQSTYSNSANVVIRVPSAQYQQVLGKVEALGTVLVLTSNSNDVRVQYTDLNATLASLQTEQGALLRLLNQSTTINSTLAIETQLQGVNQQINDIQSQILQTRTLIDYATIDVTVTQTAQQIPLSISLSATPRNGSAPLSVTFNAIVKGGAQPYIVNYNFGDGYASEGQIVIHTYYQAGVYYVLATATDQNGTVVQASATVKVQAPQAQSGLSAFLGNVGGLFISVVEGIVEVAVVVLPIAAVGAAIIIPIQRRSRGQKSVKQNQ